MVNDELLQNTTETQVVHHWHNTPVIKAKLFPVTHDSVTLSVIDPFLIASEKKTFNQRNSSNFYEQYWEKIKTKENWQENFFTVKTISPIANKTYPISTYYFDGKFDWIIGISFFLFLLVAILRMYYTKVLIQTFKSTVNLQSARKLISEKSSLIQKASFILTTIYLLGTGLFIFEIFHFYRISFYDLKGILMFLISVCCIVIFYFSKAFLYWFSGVIINSENEITETLSNFNIFYRTTGIVLLPFIISIPYVPDNIAVIFIYIGIAIFSISFILRLIRGFVLSFKAKLSLFYSFLYFCMLEILPMLYLFKLYKEMT